MGLLSKLVTTKSRIHPYIQELEKFKEREGHPYVLALNSYHLLQTTSTTTEEFFIFMVEDILASSLYATFYEELLKTAHQNPSLTNRIVQSFAADEESRERVIAEQSQLHLDFLLNNGQCKGCQVCDHHQDVADLLPELRNSSLPFFKNLYLGMQTIQFAMEEIIFDRLVDGDEWTTKLDHQTILKLRKDLFDYAEKRNSN